MVRVMIVGVLSMIALVPNSLGADVPAKPANEQFERLKKLAGTWVEANKDGTPSDKILSVVKLTAGGSAIQETLFPGQTMEMISVYHLDQGDLIMTHYCVLGNQPRMKADPKSGKNQIHFTFAGGTNLDPTRDKHMHEATLTFVDDDHITITGCAWDGGKRADDQCCQLKLVRKK